MKKQKKYSQNFCDTMDGYTTLNHDTIIHRDFEGNTQRVDFLHSEFEAIEAIEKIKRDTYDESRVLVRYNAKPDVMFCRYTHTQYLKSTNELITHEPLMADTEKLKTENIVSVIIQNGRNYRVYNAEIKEDADFGDLKISLKPRDVMFVQIPSDAPKHFGTVTKKVIKSGERQSVVILPVKWVGGRVVIYDPDTKEYRDEKRVLMSGGSGKVFLPKSWIDKTIIAFLVEHPK